MLVAPSAHTPIQFSQYLFLTKVFFIKTNVADPVIGLRPENFMQHSVLP